MAKDKKKISVVTPCYNEEGNVRECYEKLKEIFTKQLSNYDYEHIFCDNSSDDETLKILRKIANEDPRVKIIVNSRNFGVFNSMFNGMLAASGDAVIPFMPADMQDPPELIPEFIKHWEQGYEIVYGVRSQREESSIMHGIRRLYYYVVNRFANINIPLNVGEFTLIDKKVYEALRQYDDYYPYLRGMIANCGFRSTAVPYTWKARKRGKSKANLYALVDTGLNGLISFTNIPMRICMFIGFITAALSICYAVITFIATLIWFKGVAPPGVPTLIVALFFFSGVLLFFLGILGEYISAIHFQVRKRPLVVERERINFQKHE
ncbi:MAG: glycosyltransferase family 2 protein [Proteobacteria bacterium]|nr:glycosyltransferase family 2 protein [Pseudomonadota bacterium]MBU1584354.1 glycosyltransferase family 2 protein [Pseudomonadota bacterium]MBU2455893.1 glycosyltransferase family 2 protein [Pseudomonadota bacterium]